MGFWSKGLERAQTGEKRLENDNRMFLSYKDKNIKLDCYPEMLNLATGEFVRYQFDRYHDMVRTYKGTPTLRFRISHVEDVEYMQNELYKLSDHHLSKLDVCDDSVFHDMTNINEYIIVFKNMYIQRMYDNVIECSADWSNLKFI